MCKRTIKLFVIVVLVVGLLLPAASTATWPESQAGGPTELDAAHAPGRILVKFRKGLSATERLQAHAENGVQFVAEMPGLGVQVVEVADDQMAAALARYRAKPMVAYAEPDYLAEGSFSPNDAYYASSQYGPQQIQANLAWNISTGDANVIVAVLDSGADFGHPDLQGKLIAGWDYVNNDADPSDDSGHGTHVTGIAGAATNNAQGVAGVGFNTRLLVVKVLDRYNYGYYSTVASGIVYAADHGARIINLSLGGSAWSLSLSDAVDYAWNHGCLLVAAAGNNNSSAPSYPAALEHVIGVSATDWNDARWSLSNFGSYISVAAPGQGIYSTDWLGGVGSYGARSGTSQAAPHVSGVAALLLAQDGSRSNAQLRSIIESTADDLGVAGWDPYFGFGRVNAYRALRGSAVPKPTLPPIPTPTQNPTSTSTSTPTRTATPTSTTTQISTSTSIPTRTATSTSTSIPAPTSTPTAAPIPTSSATMHIGDLATSTSPTGQGWKATVTITVHDGNDNALANAKVSASWSGDYTRSVSCTTDDTGECNLTTPNLKTTNTSVTLTVSNVTRSGFTYQSSANHDSDGDSNGTQITVNRP